MRITAWQILSSLFLLALVGAVAALAVLNAGRNLPPVRVTLASSPTTASTILPTPAVTPRVTRATAPTPTPSSTQTAAVQPTPVEEPTPPPPSPTPAPTAAVIANTSGQGVSVRLEPGQQSQRAGVLREGTKVLLTGNDETVAARPWREIETEDHRLKGWVLADFLQMQGP